MKILVNWLVSALIVLAIAYILPGVAIESFLVAIVVALILGILNAVLKPILIFLTLPINMLTLGLFTLVINAIIVLLVENLVKGFSIDNFLWALLFSLILSIANGVKEKIFD
jgi:putative membrane protein